MILWYDTTNKNDEILRESSVSIGLFKKTIPLTVVSELKDVVAVLQKATYFVIETARGMKLFKSISDTKLVEIDGMYMSVKNISDSIRKHHDKYISL